MKVAVLNQKGEKVEDLTLSKNFDVEVSAHSRTLYVNYLRSALRSPIANTKDRSEVSGGGKKPWKQKGTGNARVGSSRSPLWIHGGVTFGPNNDQNFKIRINHKEKKKIFLSIISEMVKNNKLVVLTDLKLSDPKTKDAFKILDNIKVEGKISVVISPSDENAYLSFRNMSGVKPMKSSHLDAIHLMSSDKTVISKLALEEYEKIYTSKAEKEVINE